MLIPFLDGAPHGCVATASADVATPVGAGGHYRFVLSRNNANPFTDGASERFLELVDHTDVNDPNAMPVSTTQHYLNLTNQNGANGAGSAHVLFTGQKSRRRGCKHHRVGRIAFGHVRRHPHHHRKPVRAAAPARTGIARRAVMSTETGQERGAAPPASRPASCGPVIVTPSSCSSRRTPSWAPGAGTPRGLSLPNHYRAAPMSRAADRTRTLVVGSTHSVWTVH